MDNPKVVESDQLKSKLMEIISHTPCCGFSSRMAFEHIADHLIANGVRLENMQATSDENKRWIPVTEQLPKTIPCGAGTAYSEAVNVLTSGRKVLTAIWDGTDFIADAEFWEAENEEITHWTPVLLPLPEV